MIAGRTFQWPTIRALLAACVLVSCTGPVWPALGHMSAHDEPNMMSVTAAWTHGQSMYTNVSSPDIYSLLYGPMAFLLQAPAVLLGPYHTYALQLWTIVPLMLSAVCFGLLARLGGARAAFASCFVVYLMGDLVVSQYQWSAKSNAWTTLLGGLGVLAAARLRPLPAVLIAALAGAALIDIRFTAGVIASVPACILWRRFDTATAAKFEVLMLAFSSLPFLLPRISLSGYVAALLHSSHHGLALANAYRNLLLQVLLLLPASVLLIIFWTTNPTRARQALRRSLPLILVGAAAGAGTVVTGAKIGAGQHHSLPLIGAAVYVTALLWRRIEPTLLRPGYTLLCCTALLQLSVGIFFATKHVHAFLTGSHDGVPPTRVIAADVDRILALHPHETVEMGYGGNAHYEYTWSRAELILSGNTLAIDANSLGEDQLGGAEPGPAVVRRYLSCPADLVLIPRGDSPFSMQNTYAGVAHLPPTLFPSAYREAFLQRYKKFGSSRYFDLYSRRAGCPQATPKRQN